jgi:diguanylate cyclase (GGDEF)-like protein
MPRSRHDTEQSADIAWESGSSSATATPCGRSTQVRETAIERHFRRAIYGLASMLAVYVFWLAFGRGSQHTVEIIDNLLGMLGPAIIAIFIGMGVRIQRRSGVGMRDVRATFCLMAAAICFTAGQVIWGYYIIVLNEAVPFPSWADAMYLCAYPFLFAGILLIPRAPYTGVSRSRRLLDGGVIITIAATFSWYFLLSPTINQYDTPLTTVTLGLAYPLADLFLFSVLMFLSLRFPHVTMDRSVALLAGGLATVVVTDSIFEYQSLYGGYPTGQLIDAGWFLGYALIGLGAIALHLPQATTIEKLQYSVTTELETRALFWIGLFPYFLLPPMIVLVLYAWISNHHDLREWGTIAGALVLLTIIVVRQVLTMIENRDLQLAAVATAEQLRDANARLRDANLWLQQLATTDALTGVTNHRAIVNAIDQEIERAERFGRPFSMLFIDLDRFKMVNDTWGHPVGDEVLRDLARVLNGSLRSVDIVGRWGGEEFVAVLPEATLDAALVAAERVRAAVEAHIFGTEDDLRLTCSISVATYPQHARERNRLVALADEALYMAKHGGRNQVRHGGEITSNTVLAALASSAL